jgi:type IV secretory pathway VirB10-like protein
VFQARPSRRRVLAAGASTAALFVAGPAALAGCTASAPGPEEPDPLEAPARRAEADAALATAVAGMHSTLAAVANALAADRATHATALRTELHRVQPIPPSAAPPAPPAAPPPVSPDKATAQAALTQAMRAAQDEAAGLVITLPGYRAALLASVAACCATHLTLLT